MTGKDIDISQCCIIFLQKKRKIFTQKFISNIVIDELRLFCNFG